MENDIGSYIIHNHLQPRIQNGTFTKQNIRPILLDYYAELLEKAMLQDIEIDPQGNIDQQELDARLVEYDRTAESQEKTKISISGGILKRSNTHNNYPGMNVDTTNSVTQHHGKGSEIFVMSPKGEIHMASHKIGKYHHSSLLAGKPTAAAGTMEVNDGRIEYLDNKSGHYRPSEAQVRQVLYQLKEAGVNMNFDLTIMPRIYNGRAQNYIEYGAQGDLTQFEQESSWKLIQSFSSFAQSKIGKDT